MNMRQVLPGKIQDKAVLCRLLNRYLEALETSPLGVRLHTLSHDTQIPEAVFQRLLAANAQADNDEEITTADYHILFSNLMFRFPTVRIWEDRAGEWFFEY